MICTGESLRLKRLYLLSIQSSSYKGRAAEDIDRFFELQKKYSIARSGKGWNISATTAELNPTISSNNRDNGTDIRL
jgi:hypothetical protein